jgi:hypothetical protein
MSNFVNVPADLSCKLFDTLIRPILLYNSEVWFMKNYLSIYKSVNRSRSHGKKNNSLDKSNYRPISVLPTISKFYERAIFDQLMEFLNNHFNPLLSAFRSGFGCQMALLRIIEDWKKALDDNKFIAAILMDLSPTQFINVKIGSLWSLRKLFKTVKKLLRKQH